MGGKITINSYDFSEEAKLYPNCKRVEYDNGDIYIGEWQSDFR